MQLCYLKLVDILYYIKEALINRKFKQGIENFITNSKQINHHGKLNNNEYIETLYNESII